MELVICSLCHSAYVQLLVNEGICWFLSGCYDLEEHIGKDTGRGRS
jgi:hypothetical protein